MCSSYPGIKLKPALGTWAVKIEHLLSCSRCPLNCKTGHFTSKKERERLQNVKRWKMHVQSVQKILFFIVKYANLWVFCYRRRRDCLSSLIIKDDIHSSLKWYFLSLLIKMNWLRWQQKPLKYPASLCRQNNRISLFRAIQSTKYNLWTRTVNYGLAQLSVRADRKKGSLGNHNADGSGTSCKNHFSFIQKYHACKMRCNYECWNEIAICGLKITRKNNIWLSHVLHAASKQ